MHVLEIYAPSESLAALTALLGDMAGVAHVVRVGETTSGLVLLTADVEPSAVDELLPKLTALGVADEEISLVRRDAGRPLAPPRPGDIPAWSGGPLAWTELALASRQYARAVPRYLVLMGAAGVIAAFGVLTRNTILIVGAMAISPDLLPLCATCVGVVDRRFRLAGRAAMALVVGLAAAALTACAVTAILRRSGYEQAQRAIGDGGLGVLPTVNVATVVVALVAGVVGILAFETRSASAVGVAISVTTIPAAAYLGVAAAVRDNHGARGAAAVLAVNVGMLLIAGTVTLVAQRLSRRHR